MRALPVLLFYDLMIWFQQNWSDALGSASRFQMATAAKENGFEPIVVKPCKGTTRRSKTV